MQKDEQSLKVLQSLVFGHPMDPDTITGVSMTTFKKLAGMKLIEKAYPVDPGLTTSCAVLRTGSRDFSLRDR